MRRRSLYRNTILYACLLVVRGRSCDVFRVQKVLLLPILSEFFRFECITTKFLQKNQNNEHRQRARHRGYGPLPICGLRAFRLHDNVFERIAGYLRLHRR